MTPLADRFALRVARPERLAGLSAAEIEAGLRALVGSARAAWPDLALADEAFVAHLAERLPAEGELGALLAGIHGSDLFLACACAHGDARALAALDRRILRPARVALASFEGQGTVVDEALQALREKLFVREGDAAPKIADYTGRGTLEGWVKVALTRTALNLVRGKPRERPSAEAT